MKYLLAILLLLFSTASFANHQHQIQVGICLAYGILTEDNKVIKLASKQVRHRPFVDHVIVVWVSGLNDITAAGYDNSPTMIRDGRRACGNLGIYPDIRS